MPLPLQLPLSLSTLYNPQLQVHVHTHLWLNTYACNIWTFESVTHQSDQAHTHLVCVRVGATNARIHTKTTRQGLGVLTPLRPSNFTPSTSACGWTEGGMRPSNLTPSTPACDWTGGGIRLTAGVRGSFPASTCCRTALVYWSNTSQIQDLPDQPCGVIEREKKVIWGGWLGVLERQIRIIQGFAWPALWCRLRAGKEGVRGREGGLACWSVRSGKYRESPDKPCSVN